MFHIQTKKIIIISLLFRLQQLESGTLKTTRNSENQVHDEDDSSDDNISYEYESSDDDDDNGRLPGNRVRDLEWDDTLAV